MLQNSVLLIWNGCFNKVSKHLTCLVERQYDACMGTDPVREHSKPLKQENSCDKDVYCLQLFEAYEKFIIR